MANDDDDYPLRVDDEFGRILRDAEFAMERAVVGMLAVTHSSGYLMRDIERLNAARKRLAALIATLPPEPPMVGRTAPITSKEQTDA